MRLIIAAVGRLKTGPERELAERYRDRALKAGRGVGIREVEMIEVGESRARDAERRMIEESIALAQLIPERAAAVFLDSKGENLNSAAICQKLQGWRDGGHPAAVFIIGGPDGLAQNLREKAKISLAFGAATWPHQLVRVMLLEQLYRAVSIMAGHPYHRA